MNKDTHQTPDDKLKSYLDALYAKSQPLIRAEVELAIKSDAAKEYHQSQQEEVPEYPDMVNNLWDFLCELKDGKSTLEETYNKIHPYLQPAMPESDKTVQTLVDAIETTITGIEWNSENKPECFRKADAEHLQYLRDTLTEYKQSKTSSDAV